MTNFRRALAGFFGGAAAWILTSLVLAQEQWLVLDCPVSKSNPAFDIAGVPMAGALVRMERYRFVIPFVTGAGVVATIQEANIPVQVIATDTHFQIYFANKYVVIDRMTAEFLVSLSGAQAPLGGGSCTKLEQRKF